MQLKVQNGPIIIIVLKHMIENLQVISVSRLELYFTDLFLLECILIFKYKSE